MSILGWILTLAILSGQIIRIPLGIGAINALDIFVIISVTFYLLKFHFKFSQTPQSIKAAFLFITISCISLFLTPLKLTTQEWTISFSYILRFTYYVMFAYVLLSGGLKNLRNKILDVLTLSGVALAALGLLQFLILPDLKFLEPAGWDPHYLRTVSTFLDPNFAGAYFVLTLLLIFHTPKSKLFYLSFIIVYLALLTTFSRSSYGTFLIAFSAISFLKKSWKLQIITTLLFATLYLIFQIYTQIITEPRNIDREQSAISRINTWQQGFEIFKQNPLLGVGFNAYRYAIKQYNLSDEQFIRAHGSSSNDSSLLFVLSTTGIIGFLAYLYFLFTLLGINYPDNRTKIIPAISGLLFSSLFANSLFFPPILLMVLLIGVPKK